MKRYVILLFLILLISTVYVLASVSDLVSQTTIVEMKASQLMGSAVFELSGRLIPFEKESSIGIRVATDTVSKLEGIEIYIRVTGSARENIIAIRDSVFDYVNSISHTRLVYNTNLSATQTIFLPLSRPFKTNIKSVPSQDIYLTPDFIISFGTLTDAAKIQLRIIPKKRRNIGAPTTLTINSDPSNASVYIDGKPVGMTSSSYPLTVQNVLPGTHYLEVVKPGYAPYKSIIDVKENKENELFVMLKGFGSLVLSSDPKGANVFIDGDFKGITPLTINKIQATSHEIRMTRDGYNSVTFRVNVKPYATTTRLVKLTTFGTIEVISEPSDADVYVDGYSVGKTPVKAKVDVGEHTVRISKNHYFEVEKKVKVNVEQVVQVTEKLKPMGVIVVTSIPSGAQVYVNGIYKGTTPVEVHLSGGEYLLKVYKEGYGGMDRKVKIQPLTTKAVSFELKPVGSVGVESEPKQAKVFLDGDYIGTTPLVLQNLSFGEHEIIIMKDNYERWTRKIRIETPEKRYIHAILTPYSGSLHITSIPSVANVYINGEKVGITPFTKENIPVGIYNIKVVKGDLGMWEEKVKIERNKTTDLNPDLTIAGLVDIRTIPVDNASVFIDGIYKGNTPLRLSLLSGKHRITIRHPDYSDWSGEIILAKGEIKDIKIDLRDMGSLTILTDPVGSTIYIDGKDVGISPYIDPRVAVGKYNILISKSGYNPITRIVAVKKGQETKVNLTLEPLSRISVNTYPPACNIFVDDKEFGKSPIIVSDLQKGKHVVTVKHVGYKTSQQLVTLVPGETRIINVFLKESPFQATITTAPIPSGYHIEYTITRQANTNVYVTNSNNSLRAIILKNKSMPPGTHEITWDGKDEDGNYLPDGEYTLNIRAVSIFGDTAVARTALQIKRAGQIYVGALPQIFGSVLGALSTVIFIYFTFLGR